MRWRHVRQVPARVRLLVTRRATWVDVETGDEHTVRESWRTVWALAGVHSYHWWWVRHWGPMECGCTRNPLTRRMLLISFECRKHLGFDPRDPMLRLNGSDEKGEE